LTAAVAPTGHDLTEQVRAAYRWILGREADEVGLGDYCGAIERGEITLAEARRLLLQSAEFRRSNGAALAIVEIGHGLRAVIDRQEPEFGRHIAATGTWEPHIVEVIRASLSPGDTFVDIGANVGLMSFHAAATVGPGGKVIAFEPNPRNVDCYRRGLAANRFDHVLLYPFAASDTFRLMTTTTASNAKVTDDADPLTRHDVGQAVPIDFILRDEPRIDLIKIDIEGHELPAFLGMAQSLRRHRPLVLAEFNPLCLLSPGGIDPAVLADHLFGLTDTVEIVESDGSRTAIRSAAALMVLWQDRDAEATAAGRLPPGWVHFDLLFRPSDAVR
jgi:FkbM family methyltransferase